jgi:hypothetical protein
MPEGCVAPMGIIKYENSEILLYKHNSEIIILVNDSKRMNFLNLYIHVFKCPWVQRIPQALMTFAF